MQAGRLTGNKRTEGCNRNTQMRWQWQYVAIAARCLEATFSLTGEEEAERIKGVEVFKYLGRLLEQSDNDWQAVLCNTLKELQVWWKLGKLLRREGAEPEFLAKFYCSVVQAVLLFGV